MEAHPATPRDSRLNWRIWAVVPVLLLALAVGVVVTSGSSLVDLVGTNPPPADEFDIRRVEFSPGEIRITVRNPQPDDLTIANVNVDDAIVLYTVDGPTTLGRLRSSTIVVPFDWVDGDPITVGVTSSTGIETVEEIPAAIETPQPSVEGFFGYALIGLLVGVLPVALGLLWLPALRQASAAWLSAFMAFTAGLLSFLGVEALSEAFSLQAGLTGVAGRLGTRAARRRAELPRDDCARRSSDAGRHRDRAHVGAPHRCRDRAPQPRRRARHRRVVRDRRAPARSLPDRRLHDPQRDRGPRYRDAGREDPRHASSPSPGSPSSPERLRSSAAWVGGYTSSDVLIALFFAIAAGAAFQVVVEVGRYVARTAPGGLRSGHAIVGFIVGIATMYVTGLLVA